jgi:ferredoxin-type protein NapG
LSDELNDEPRDRRAMFLLGLKRLIGPVAQYIEQRLPVVEPEPMYRYVLRPPGALPEGEFVDTCYRCGNCVEVCPAKAIKPMTRDDVQRAGTPYIDADVAPCTLCEQMACMKACPSGALRAAVDRKAVKLGVARIDRYVCRRGSGEPCLTCLEVCPLGTEVIDFSDGGEIEVKPGACTGCGICQYRCPTIPKAIRVDPR